MLHILHYHYQNQIPLFTVYVLPTDGADVIQLDNVTIIDLSHGSVTFRGPGSPGPDIITVNLDKIVAIEHEAIPELEIE